MSWNLRFIKYFEIVGVDCNMNGDKVICEDLSEDKQAVIFYD